MSELADKSRALAKHVRMLLNGAGNVEKAAQCRTFLDKWESRLQIETAKWSEARSSLTKLHQT